MEDLYSFPISFNFFFFKLGVWGSISKGSWGKCGLGTAKLIKVVSFYTESVLSWMNLGEQVELLTETIKTLNFAEDFPIV